jgi:hypothetical protein
MTPKEKAVELFSDYRYILSIPNAPLGELKDDIAKSCALIAVDELKQESVVKNDFDYWQEVKTEIERL